MIAEATHYYMKRKGDNRIQSVKDLSGLTVGMQQGSSIHQRLPEIEALLQKTGGKLGKVSLYASFPEAYQDLANGRDRLCTQQRGGDRGRDPQAPRTILNSGRLWCRSATTHGR